MNDEATGEERVVRWYVRRECGDVQGPMSQEDAEFESGRLDGAVMFNERIFEPEFVVSNEVDILIGELRAHLARAESGCGPESDCNTLIRRSVDALILLSKQKPVEVDFSVAVLLAELQGLCEAKEIIREGEDDAIGTMLGRVMAALTSLSREKVVTGHIEGGLLNLGVVPEGVSIDIRDCDTDGVDPELLKTDDDGETYFEVG
ncbi:hypothetical protein LCGC14_2898560 [marine sediment metagenome]|uniref:Uncharacterized protein n=1 Tax=marine sediment metagenome TaxID=412755 RepID=A0A0F9A307_9ZZZZ